MDCTTWLACSEVMKYWPYDAVQTIARNFDMLLSYNMNSSYLPKGLMAKGVKQGDLASTKAGRSNPQALQFG
jgi:hypothetical protein